MMTCSLAGTSLERWRLNVSNGDQCWEYLEDDEAVEQRPQTFAEKYFLGISELVRCFENLCPSYIRASGL